MKLISFVVPTHLPGMGGWGNGYVALPKGHPCFGMGYDDIYHKYGINVHGGLTFSESKHAHQPDETKGMWIVGFDTLHYGDNMQRWPNAEAVMAEANSLKRQLEKIKKRKE